MDPPAWPVAFWIAVTDMAPYLLLGFLAAGLLSQVCSSQTIATHLGGEGWRPIGKAALLGVPLPLCSCGVLPVAAALRRQGAGKGATTAFLLSTPQTGVDSIAATYAMFGPILAFYRPLAALVSGILGGLLVSCAEPKDRQGVPVSSPSGGAGRSGAFGSQPRSLRRALQYGFVELPRELALSLLVGLLVGAGIAVALPAELVNVYLGSSWAQMLAMLLLSLPLYVCATGSIPVAAALVQKGLSPGAVLVFLIAGPATNAAALATLSRLLGLRSTLCYLLAAIATALLSGLLFDTFFPLSVQAYQACAHDWLPGWLKAASGVLLLALLLVALWPRLQGILGRKRPEPAQAVPEAGIRLRLSGLHCESCATAIATALRALPGVDQVAVDRPSGTALIQGTGLDPARILAEIAALGYEAHLNG